MGAVAVGCRFQNGGGVTMPRDFLDWLLVLVVISFAYFIETWPLDLSLAAKLALGIGLGIAVSCTIDWRHS
jgi:hypothetical protein